MGRGTAPAAQKTSVPGGSLLPGPETIIGDITGTAAMRGTGRPLRHPAAGGLGLTRGAVVVWSEDGSVMRRAVGSRGVPIGQIAARDPAVAVKEMAA